MRTTRRFVQNLAVTCALLVFSSWAFGQKDPGVRGGIQNTGGGLQQQGIPIPHPPLISPNPTTGATIKDNELASFIEGIRLELPPAAKFKLDAATNSGNVLVDRDDIAKPDAPVSHLHQQVNGGGTRIEAHTNGGMIVIR
jgi:hypothetical protein